MTRCTCYLHRCISYFYRVVGQYTTKGWYAIKHNQPINLMSLLNILADLNIDVLSMVSVFPDFQLFESPFQAFGDSSKGTNNNWYYLRPYTSQIFFCLLESPIFSVSSIFTLWSAGTENPLDIFSLFSFVEFFTLALADGLSLELVWQQVSRTLLSILADLNNVVVRMVSTCPLISNFPVLLPSFWGFFRAFQLQSGF